MTTKLAVKCQCDSPVPTSIPPCFQPSESAKAGFTRTGSDWKSQQQLKNSGDVGVETLVTRSHRLGQRGDAIIVLLSKFPAYDL